MGFYLYRFVDEKDRIIYIGRTNDIRRRILKEHFTDNTHLPKECYLETKRIEYVEITNESEEVAYEAILINQIRPKYNVQFKDEGDFNVKIPEFNWDIFEWEYNGQLDWLKKKKMGVINAKDVMVNCMSQSEQQIALTGIIDVDSRVIMIKQSLTLIAGVSGSGKTDYLLNIAKHNAAKGKRVLFINLKNAVEELSVRLLSIDSHISLQKIVQRQMTDSEWEKVIKCIENRNSDEILFYNANQNYLEIKNIMSEIMSNSVDLVIIDDIQMIEDEGNRFAKERMDYVLKNIRTIAGQLSVPIIGAYCIPGKEIEKRADRRPLLSDLEYNSLLTYPDNILLLYRDWLYNMESEKKNIEEIFIAKNMIGDTYHAKMIVTGGVCANFQVDTKSGIPC